MNNDRTAVGARSSRGPIVLYFHNVTYILVSRYVLAQPSPEPFPEPQMDEIWPWSNDRHSGDLRSHRLRARQVLFLTSSTSFHLSYRA